MVELSNVVLELDVVFGVSVTSSLSLSAWSLALSV